MLRVLKVDGEELFSTGAEDVRSLASAKRHIRQIYGIPLCVQRLARLRQRSRGSPLEGSSEPDVQADLDENSELKVPVDLQLVRLTEPRSMQEAEDEFMEVAVAEGNAEVAESLLRLGLDEDTLMQSRQALVEASRKGHLGIVQLLLATKRKETDDGISEHSVHTNGIGNEPEHGIGAWSEPRPEENGADGPLTYDESNASAFARIDARLMQEKRMFRQFLQLTRRRNEISKALVEASRTGHVDVVRFLLRGMPATDRLPASKACEAIGEALVCAAGQGHDKILELLLDTAFGEDVCFASKEDLFKGPCSQAAALASENGHDQIAQLLQARAGPRAEAAMGDADACKDS